MEEPHVMSLIKLMGNFFYHKLMGYLIQKIGNKIYNLLYTIK